jgi:hypothetical protein
MGGSASDRCNAPIHTSSKRANNCTLQTKWFA